MSKISKEQVVLWLREKARYFSETADLVERNLDEIMSIEIPESEVVSESPPEHTQTNEPDTASETSQ